MNKEFTLPVAFQEEYMSHVTPLTDIILVTLLNEEKDIEGLMKMVNEDGANKRSEEDEWHDDYEDTENKIYVHLEDSNDDNEIEDDE